MVCGSLLHSLVWSSSVQFQHSVNGILSSSQMRFVQLTTWSSQSRTVTVTSLLNTVHCMSQTLAVMNYDLYLGIFKASWT